MVVRSQFNLMSGVISIYPSSPPVQRGFCRKCGTQLTYAHESSPDNIELTTASLDEPGNLQPTKEIWLSDKLPWAAVSPNLEHHSEDAQASNYQQPGWHTVTPRIIVAGAEKLVEFVKHVFGAAGQYRSQAPAELRLGDSIIMVSDAGVREPTTACLYVYVESADITWHRAIEAGAQAIEPPLNTPYGDRRGMIKDAWGNTWQIATRRRGQATAE